ncbi:hypothetical protein GQ43DRAFT_417290 [Delitschia confertaspora ATCC 74209]|uniref:RING-type E3 ubiquitin transferase n=1 Tax=Delitschia confertaspora ATCC 74209 TaxID=1513339 RepID=A0A9P4JK06_9PLEO|nr:hypothetical protein GQ43DRAFT_417290 [Delitschia confertaspora ATCC 74209]
MNGPSSDDKSHDKQADDGDTCRICRGEGSLDEPLFYPCKCSGSIKFVHQDCLMEWLSHSQKKHCELCKTPFRFTKLYHPHMPSSIPTTVFLRRALVHILKLLMTWCRILLVGSVWLMLLPWCMRVVWRSLFWFADGGWAQGFYESVERDFNATPSRQLDVDTIQSAIATAAASNTSLSQPIPAFFMPFSQTLNISAGEPTAWYLIKRFFFGIPSSLSESNSTVPANVTDHSNFAPDVLGNPSLLSNVSFFKWFDSPAANRFLIDVVEGQIITLLVVVAFVLIFLIREWVVQQQPVINMVALGGHNAPAVEPIGRAEDAELDEEAVEEGAAEEEDDDGDEEDDDGDEEDDDEGSSEDIARILAALPPEESRKLRDSLTDLSQSIESESRLSEGGDEIHDDQDSTGASGGDSGIDSIATSAGNADIDPSVESSLQRPNMPARDRSFMATGIRRELEEGESWSFSGIAPNTAGEEASLQVERPEVPDSWEDQETGIADQDQGSDHSSESWQQVPIMLADDSTDPIAGARQVKAQGKTRALMETADRPVGEQVGTSSFLEASYPAAPEEPRIVHVTESESSAGPARVVDSETEPRAEEEVDRPVPVDPEPARQHAQRPVGLVGRAIDWLWGDVAPDAVQGVDDGINDEHVVQNFADEAPFVPFVGNEPREPPIPAVQDPEVAAAAAQAGIDINDQDAIDEAEDLEGIMELIGMQGPLTGLFQNAMFSAVLIAATVAAAVWFPYLWGKVVLLFMGSPISLFIKLPLQLLAVLADVVVDTAICIAAGGVFWGTRVIRTIVWGFSFGQLSAYVEKPIAIVAKPAQSIAINAMERMGKLIVESSVLSSPNYFHLSVNSHIALRTIQNATSTAFNQTGEAIISCYEAATSPTSGETALMFARQLPATVQLIFATTFVKVQQTASWIWASKSYKITLDLGQSMQSSNTAIEEWTTTDRVIAILAGYVCFAVIGALYVKRGAPFTSSQQGRIVEGIVAELLQQAGGVVKVILIISIEMLAFPLYCGLLLDIALLPLFENASLYSRWQFTFTKPWTSGFVHWFIGTCYMFHFALFVSMCRKIMRSGVLYFIRDPDDPTFHPVRDVLERSVTTQLRKIAFSALVYGGLVIICLGGVVWGLDKTSSGVLPIHWVNHSPSLEFPIDLLFYNFLTPLVIKIYKPSEGLHQMYEWWFRTCARLLRLSSFLIGEKSARGAYFVFDGKYVRAPASDQVRIPKGQAVFVEVDHNNNRKDGKPEHSGVHARDSDMVTVVYIPPRFRIRIALFILTIWVFAAVTGVSITVLPLLFGRYLFSLILMPPVAMNDIHAFSLGIYTLGAMGYAVYQLYKLLAYQYPSLSPFQKIKTAAAAVSKTGARILRVGYVYTCLVLLVPILFALCLELYILIPLHAYLGPKEPHVVHLIQDWTLGFLYARLAARFLFMDRNSIPARAFRAVIADGYTNPNARLATRCFLVPMLFSAAVLFLIPGALAWLLNRTIWLSSSDAFKSQVWRFCYPCVASFVGLVWAGKEGASMVNKWRMVVRDEVYLIGERLHNFGEKRPPAGTGIVAESR